MKKQQGRVFKKCPSCKKKWSDYEEFLADPYLKLIGYQMFLEDLKEGLFLFNHSCGTTLSLTVQSFEHLYDGPVYDTRALGGENCPGLCLIKKETASCSEECDCAYVRAIMQTIKAWHKRKSSASSLGEAQLKSQPKPSFS